MTGTKTNVSGMRLCGIALSVVLAALVWAFGVSGAGVAAAEEAADPFAGSVEVNLADGTYEVEVSLEGGTGRASIASPAEVAVKGRHAAITCVWSSPHYDYMIVDGVRYLPEIAGEHSCFQIPVLALGEPFEVVADTTAMSEPHEITYAITVDEASLAAAANAAAGAGPFGGGAPMGLMVAVVCGVLAAMYIMRKRSGA